MTMMVTVGSQWVPWCPGQTDPDQIPWPDQYDLMRALVGHTRILGVFRPRGGDFVVESWIDHWLVGTTRVVPVWGLKWLQINPQPVVVGNCAYVYSPTSDRYQVFPENAQVYDDTNLVEISKNTVTLKPPTQHYYYVNGVIEEMPTIDASRGMRLNWSGNSDDGAVMTKAITNTPKAYLYSQNWLTGLGSSNPSNVSVLGYACTQSIPGFTPATHLRGDSQAGLYTIKPGIRDADLFVRI